jgi:hypothetical protein
MFFITAFIVEVRLRDMMTSNFLVWAPVSARSEEFHKLYPWGDGPFFRDHFRRTNNEQNMTIGSDNICE